MPNRPALFQNVSERLVSLWYSRYRAVIVILPTALFIAALAFTPSSSTPPPSLETRFGTPDSLPTPTSSLPESASFASFNEKLDQPGGVTQVVVLTPPTLEQAQTLAARLGVTDLRASSNGFEGTGLEVLADGTWSYNNPTVKSPVDEKECPLGTPCTPPAGVTLPSAAKALPTPEDAGKLAKELFKDLGADITLKSVKSDQWRARVELMFNHEIQVLPEVGSVVFLDNSVILSASGVVGTLTSTEDVVMPSAKAAFKDIDSSTFYPASINPAVGSEIEVVLVHRTGFKNRAADGRITYTPAWAFKDVNDNTWIVTPPLDTPPTTIEP
jgi:hypothetical protein